MKKLISASIAVLATLTLISPLFAAGDYSSGSKQETGAMTGSDQMSGSSQITSPAELKGMELVSQNGEKVGKIDKVTTDPQSGQIKFVTVSKGGVLGMGGEEIAVPRDAFMIDDTRQQATLTVNDSKLENVPQQANMSDEEFQQNLERHYGIAPAFKGGTQQMGTEPMGTEPSGSMGTENQRGTGLPSQSQ